MGRPYRILITGSRHASLARHGSFIRWHLLEAMAPVRAPSLTIVHGAAPGVDTIVTHLPTGGLPPVSFEAYPAEQFGAWPACGPRRNSHMVSLGADICLAFPQPGSRGTWDCAQKAANAGIPVILRTLPVG